MTNVNRMDLQSLPLELHLTLFKALPTFNSVCALSSTCHSFHSLYLSNRGTILRAVGRTSIPAFDDGLRVSRGSSLDTALLCNFDPQQRRYTSPPTHEFLKTTIIAAPPTPDDITTLLRLKALLACCLRILLDSDSADGPRMEPYDFHLHLREQLSSDGDFVERFYRAGFRLLFMGYIYSYAYVQPLRGWARGSRARVPQKVRNFPVYHTADPVWRKEQMEVLFSGVVEWIVDDGGNRGVEEKIGGLTIPGVEGTMDVRRHGALREVMLLLLIKEITNVLGGHATEKEIDDINSGKTTPFVVLSMPLFGIFDSVTVILPTSDETAQPPRFFRVEHGRVFETLCKVFPSPDPSLESRPELDVFRIALERLGVKLARGFFDPEGEDVLMWTNGLGVLLDGAEYRGAREQLYGGLLESI